MSNTFIQFKPEPDFIPDRQLFFQIEKVGDGQWMIMGWTEDEAAILRALEWQVKTCEAWKLDSHIGWFSKAASANDIYQLRLSHPLIEIAI